MRIPAPGETFQNKYKLLETVGRGGFAIVFRAREISTSRDVAVKVLLPGPRGYDFTVSRRFLREARLLAGLRDPHTLTLFDFGETADGLLYMVSEYLSGGDLASLIRTRRGLGEAVGVHVLRQLCGSLGEAHSVGILHRDIKPANVLVAPYMDDPHRVKLIDFGIAKPLETETDAFTVTQTGEVIGTPRYMAPEQICGAPLSPASDLYSLGLLAYETIVGRPAVPGDDPRDILVEQLAETPLRLDGLEGVSGPVQSVLRRMVERDPRHRFQSAFDVLDALEARPAPDPAGNSAERGGSAGARPRRASTTKVALVVLAVGVLCAVVFGALVYRLATPHRHAPRSAEPPAPSRSVHAAAPPQIAPRAGALARDDIADVGGARDVATGHDVGTDMAPSAGTSGCDQPPRTKTRTYSVPLRSMRQWKTHAPSKYDGTVPYPVVLAFDRSTVTGENLLREFRSLAGDGEFLVVAPTTQDGIAPWVASDDMELVQHALEHTRQNYCVDPTRLYAVGQGIGSKFLSERVMCEVPLSAVALGAMWITDQKFACEDPGVPLMYIMGTEDKWHPIEGGKACNGRETLSHEQHRELWRRRHRCEGKAKTYSRLATGRCETWDCETPYFHCTVDGGYFWKHTGTDLQLLWSACMMGASPYPYGQRIWKFFLEEGRDLPAEAPEHQQ